MGFLNGAGRYNEHATRIMQETGAQYVMVIVVGGAVGDGMAVQGQLEQIINTPGRLRRLATLVEKQIAAVDEGSKPMPVTVTALDPREIVRRAKTASG